MLGTGSRPVLASQACRYCKSRKRKCDKALPSCSFCARRKKPCEYERPEATKDTALGSERYLSSPDKKQLDVHAVDLSGIVFLDPNLLQFGLLDIARPTLSISQRIIQLLGSLEDIRLTADIFFKHIHQWMPFISKKRLFHIYLQSSLYSKPDMVLLFLSLKLITTLPPADINNPRTALYHTTKQFYLEAEQVFSVPVLQAGLLLALYELGHGIYPAAFLSIGACARYAYALGINAGCTVPIERVLTLVEVEERRRIWWAIVILDRFVSIGCPGRPFATTDPGPDDLLPTDDAAWDEGVIKPNSSAKVSSPMTGQMSKFALLCQAARLLGQVLVHLPNSSASQDAMSLQLDRTLQSMLAAALNISGPDHDQITFIYSALIALHAPYLSSKTAKEPASDRSRLANIVLQQIEDQISANLVKRQCFLDRDPEDVSPWGLFFAYRICGADMWSSKKTLQGSEVVNSLRQGLLRINLRWNVAGVYLQLLEAQQALYT